LRAGKRGGLDAGLAAVAVAAVGLGLQKRGGELSYRVAVTCALFSGLRLSELLGLT
jgi:hypothetical protein